MSGSKNTYIETQQTKELYSKHVAMGCDIEIDRDHGYVYCDTHTVDLFGYPEQDYDSEMEYNNTHENGLL